MDFDLTTTEPPETDSLARQFVQFDNDHPVIWELFRRFTLEAIASGRQRFSARAIFHRIRWETMIKPTGDILNPDTGKPIKLNNNWSPYYARKFLDEFPRARGFFRLRSVNH